MFSKLSRLKVSCRSTLPSPRWRKLAARTQFKIHNSLPVPLVSLVPALSILSAFSTLPPVSPVPPVPQFKIPFTLLKVLYRLEKRLSLWCIKENSRAVLFYFTDCKIVIILTTHLIHYQSSLTYCRTQLHLATNF